jgi:sterol desaturase/sphingolipid hydroxylase (fatty acid hydroxylase superfamily)
LSNCLPFSGGSDEHYFHHSNNSGNYGAILHIFDTLANTNVEYIEKENAKKGLVKNKEK